MGRISNFSKVRTSVKMKSKERTSHKVANFIVNEMVKKGVKISKTSFNNDVANMKTRPQSRRAASKEALKNMHLLLDESEPLEVTSDDDDVIPLEPPKKKYKVSNRKSVDDSGNDRNVLVLKSIQSKYVESTLKLECTFEDLSPAQLERQIKTKRELKEIKTSLDRLTGSAKVIYKGELTSAYQIDEALANVTTVAAPKPANIIVNSFQQQSQTTPQTSYQLVMDPTSGLIVGAVATPAPPPLQQPTTSTVSTTPAPQTFLQGKIQLAGNLQQTTSVVTATTSTATPTTTNALKPVRGRNIRITTPATPKPKTLEPKLVQRTTITKVAKPLVTTPKPAPVVQAKTTTQFTAAQQIAANIPSGIPFRPTESSSEGGLSMGVKRAVVDLTSIEDAAAPDSKEISFNKLQGKTYPSLVVLARPSMRQSEVNTRSKLDMKVKGVLMNPPTKFTEWLIQKGLVKSEQKCATHPKEPLKLGMYSDVTKFPYSGGYVWISICCPQKFVSVFSGSIFEGSPHAPVALLKLMYHWVVQTNIQNVTQWVKVDNLYVKGIFTWLRGICTVALQNHVRQLGGPNVKVEVGVISLGTTSQDGLQRQVKVEVLGVLETTTKYMRLKAVEPLADGDRNYKKRFGKILEPLAQWIHPESTIITDLTVDKATLHSMGYANVIQSSNNNYYTSNRTIMEYLRRIVPRMFQNTLSLLSRQIIQQFLDELVWREWFGTNQMEAFDNLLLHLSEQTRMDTAQTLVERLNKVASNPFKTYYIPPGTANGPPKPIVFETTTQKRSYRRKDAQKIQQNPPKCSSPDIPEQMVPLDHYYYGTIFRTTKAATPNDITLNIKCPLCKVVCTNNIKLMSHLFKHAHNGVDSDAILCRYCLTSCPSGKIHKHISSAHPTQTKHENGFVCLICEARFMNPFVLGKHMSKEHCPSELPYQCGTCGYRCSNHKQAIGHFYQDHDNGPTIQCPFCLKSTTVYSASRNIVQNVSFFMQHLQKHQKKQYAKKCGKCNLWFVQKDVLKEHIAKMHMSQRGKAGLSSPAHQNLIMVPKSKMDTFPNDDNDINFGALFYKVSKTMMCVECNKSMDSNKHYPSFETCMKQNCNYSTCCASTMSEHKIKCAKEEPEIAVDALPSEMFCICGFSHTDGNQLAKHLAICERKSAYPSLKEAKVASVTHSMLDVLGLVRKPEEPSSDDKKLKDLQFGPKSGSSSQVLDLICSEKMLDDNSKDEEDSEEVDDPVDDSEVVNAIEEVMEIEQSGKNEACESMEALINEVDKSIKENQSKAMEVENMDLS